MKKLHTHSSSTTPDERTSHAFPTFALLLLLTHYYSTLPTHALLCSPLHHSGTSPPTRHYSPYYCPNLDSHSTLPTLPTHASSALPEPRHSHVTHTFALRNLRCAAIPLYRQVVQLWRSNRSRRRSPRVCSLDWAKSQDESSSLECLKKSYNQIVLRDIWGNTTPQRNY